MALDEGNRRLFIGCRNPARLVVLDTASGKVTADLGISGDIEDLFYDAALKRLYLSCGEDFVDLIEQQGADSYRLREVVVSGHPEVCATVAGNKFGFRLYFTPRKDSNFLPEGA